MILFELFDTTYHLSLMHDTNNMYDLRFWDPKACVVVRFTAEKFEAGNVWELKFTRDQQSGITRQGNQYKILSTIVQCIRQLIKAKNPDKIVFAAMEPSREDLYKKMISKMAVGMGFKEERYPLDSRVFQLVRQNKPRTM